MHGARDSTARLLTFVEVDGEHFKGVVGELGADDPFSTFMFLWQALAREIRIVQTHIR